MFIVRDDTGRYLAGRETLRDIQVAAIYEAVDHGTVEISERADDGTEIVLGTIGPYV